jgi:hypothetical protein
MGLRNIRQVDDQALGERLRPTSFVPLAHAFAASKEVGSVPPARNAQKNTIRWSTKYYSYDGTNTIHEMNDDK